MTVIILHVDLAPSLESGGGVLGFGVLGAPLYTGILFRRLVYRPEV